MPTVLKPEDNGWNLIDGSYVFNWFEGNTVPSSIYEILLQQATDTAENESSEAEEHIKGNTQILNFLKIYGILYNWAQDPRFNVIINVLKLCFFLDDEISNEESYDDEESNDDISDDDED